MKSLAAPENLVFYLLVSQSSSSLFFSTHSVNHSNMSYGSGFYASRDEAEKARTLAILGDKAGNTYHIFELEFPNPAHKTG
jgi:hypothetical protein